MINNKPNLLLEAFFCNPKLQSVSLIGYKWFRELRDLTNCTLITHIRNKNSLNREVSGSAEIIYIDTEKFSKTLLNLSKKIPRKLQSITSNLFLWLDYALFSILAKKKVKEMLKSQSFDIHHKVTPVSVSSFSSISSVGIPSIIGPLNSGMDWPKGFEDYKYATKEGQGRVYQLLSRFWYSKIPASKFKDCKLILVATSATTKALPKEISDKCRLFLENGVDINDFVFKLHHGNAINCLYVGRLIPFKAVDILIYGFQKAFHKNNNLRLIIVGDGSERSCLEELVKELNIKEFVNFIGEVPNLKVAEFMQKADIFLMSSLRESGGGVLLEAMSCGAVPIVVAHGGPNELVTEKTGIKIKPLSEEQLIASFKNSILKLALNVDLRHQIAREGRKLVEENYDWKVKAKRMLEIYKEVLLKNRQRA